MCIIGKIWLSGIWQVQVKPWASVYQPWSIWGLTSSLAQERFNALCWLPPGSWQSRSPRHSTIWSITTKSTMFSQSMEESQSMIRHGSSERVLTSLSELPAECSTIWKEEILISVKSSVWFLTKQTKWWNLVSKRTLTEFWETWRKPLKICHNFFCSRPLSQVGSSNWPPTTWKKTGRWLILPRI